MLFNSYSFIFLFLPITLTGFFLIGNRGHHRIALSWLVGCSLFFYAWWNPAYLGLLLFSIFLNYGMGLSLFKSSTKPKDKRYLLAIGIAINLGLLGYYKYANFFITNLNDLTSSQIHLETIILPLAISFFTFQQIAYLVDAYRGETREYNFLHYTLFVTFFPQLIAGPIVHHREMLPQFAQKKTYHFCKESLIIGLTIFIIGLFKKVVIADNFALHASPVFLTADAGGSLDFFSAWEGAISYSLQLYFDFSGYSDMAIGLARMFGIKLPVNFNAPYKAQNITEFWRRWHMTLSRFLKDYLYIALGGNRKGPTRRTVNLFLTMLLGGLWHGAGWTFIAWGALHGFYLILNHAWHILWTKPLNRWWSITIARTITLLAVMIGWIFFRAQTVDGALNIISGMTNLPTSLHERIGFLEPLLTSIGFGFKGGYLAYEHVIMLGWGLISMAIVLFWPTTQELMENHEPALNIKPSEKRYWWTAYTWNPTITWGIIIGTLAALSVTQLSSVSEFLYFQF